MSRLARVLGERGAYFFLNIKAGNSWHLNRRRQRDAESIHSLA